MIQSYKDLEVYKRSFKIAMDIFWMSREFPKEEIYSLTSQITRSSRSISANISEGWAKRSYESVFKQHLIHSLGSCSETENWLEFALRCKYIEQQVYDLYADELDQIGKMLNKLHQNWKSHGK
ncbi:MAG: four helix bundle protein [Bacteroidetes bacterium]|nr:four helix bundle protein [Bacteroidota bacterium]MDA1119886.1 four helix bundle protein [Bacteroidota bacterium]